MLPENCRRRRIVHIESIADLATLPVIDGSPGIADAGSRQQELEFLANAVRTLPERCRQTLRASAAYKPSPQQIPAELKISEYTIKAQLANVILRCTEYLEDHGLVSLKAHARRKL